MAAKKKFVVPYSHPYQSRTGSVLGAVPSAAVMGTHRIFFQGEGANLGMQKS